MRKLKLRRRKIQLCDYQNHDFHSVRLLFVVKSECKVGIFGGEGRVWNTVSKAREGSLLICSLARSLYFMALQHLRVGISQQLHKSCKNYLMLHIK